ncbi:MAG: hypothetical protein PHQ23_02405 [Candidatus Wallbacteria bacterium]|nr:hypothetical protein [Candidatus Wallbacteria bacterium]
MIKFFVCFLISMICIAVTASSIEVNDMIQGFRTNPGLYYQPIVDYAQSGHLSEVLHTLPAGDEFAPILMEIKEWAHERCRAEGRDYKAVAEALNQRRWDAQQITDLDVQIKSENKLNPERKSAPGSFALETVAITISQTEEDLFNNFFSPSTIFRKTMVPSIGLIRKADFDETSGNQTELAAYNKALTLLFNNKNYLSAYNEFNKYLTTYPNGAYKENAIFLKAYCPFYLNNSSCEILIQQYATDYPTGEFKNHAVYVKAINEYKMEKYSASYQTFSNLYGLNIVLFKEESVFFKAASKFLTGDYQQALVLAADYTAEYQNYADSADFIKHLVRYSRKDYAALLSDLIFITYSDNVTEIYRHAVCGFCHRYIKNFKESNLEFSFLLQSSDLYLQEAGKFEIQFNLFQSGEFDASVAIYNKIQANGGFQPIGKYVLAFTYLARLYDNSDNYWTLADNYFLVAARALTQQPYMDWAEFRSRMMSCFAYPPNRADMTPHLLKIRDRNPGTELGELASLFALISMYRYAGWYNFTDFDAAYAYFLENYSASQYKPVAIAVKALFGIGKNNMNYAEACFTELVYKYPGTIYERDARYYLIELYNDNSQWQKQAANMEAFLVKFGQDLADPSFMMERLIDLYIINLSNPGRAVYWAGQAIELTDNLDRKSMLISKRADCNYQLGETELARADYQWMIDSGSPEAKAKGCFGLARCHLDHKEYLQALPLLQQLEQINSYKLDYAVFYQGVCHETLGDYQKASFFYNRLKTQCSSSTYVKEADERLTCLSIGPITGFTGTYNKNYNQIELKWTRPSQYSLLTGYNLFRKCLSDQGFTLLCRIKYNSTDYYNDSAIATGLTYVYCLSGITKFGSETPKSQTVEILVDSVPTAPTNLTYVAQLNQIQLTWSTVTKHESRYVNYRVFTRVAAESGWSKLADTYSNTYFTDTSAKIAGKTYQYLVRAYDSDSGIESKDSNIVSFTCNWLNPPTITLIENDAGTGSMFLSYQSKTGIREARVFMLNTSEASVVPSTLSYRYTYGVWESDGNIIDPENTVPNATALGDSDVSSYWEITFTKTSLVTKIIADTRYAVEDELSFVTKSYYLYIDGNYTVGTTQGVGNYLIEYQGKIGYNSKLKLYSSTQYASGGATEGQRRASLMRFYALSPKLEPVSVNEFVKYDTTAITRFEWKEDYAGKSFIATFVDENGLETTISNIYKAPQGGVQ